MRNPGFVVVVGDVTRVVDVVVITGRKDEVTDTTVLDADTPRNADTTVPEEDAAVLDADRPVLDADTIVPEEDAAVLDGAFPPPDGCREPAGRRLISETLRAIERTATPTMRITLSFTLPHSGRTAPQATARRAVRRATATRSDKVRWSVGASAL